MDQRQRDMVSNIYSFSLIILTALITYHFFLPLAWAAVIAIISWPLYLRCESLCNNHRASASFLLTSLITITIAVPLLYVMKLVINETHIVSNFILAANRHGVPPPDWLINIPGIGHALLASWDKTIGRPHYVSAALNAEMHNSLMLISNFLKRFGMQIVHRTIVFGFTLLCLFFFYKDGRTLLKQINATGKYCLDDRWQLYARHIPLAIKATVNGLILVGIGVGFIMGICYAIFGLSAPALLGAVTALAAMIPFVAPVLFTVLAAVLIAQGKIISGLLLFAIGSVVLFIADHFIRPQLITGSIRLHFLAVLFGILGGVETMGIIGLFIGPTIMILFTTLWHEPEVFGNTA